LLEHTTSGQGAIYAFPGSLGADAQAVDALICGIAGGIDSVIAAELGVEVNSYRAGERR